MTRKSELGSWGEDKACEYLVDKGFKVVERNFWKPWGELDIVAIAPDKTLVFVEVKTMRDWGAAGIVPEDHMTASKLKRFKRAASLYAGNRPELVEDDKGWRLDLLSLTESKKDFVIKYYENVGE